MDIWVRVLLPIIESLFFLITAWLVGRFILSKIKAWQSFGLLLQFALSVLVGYSGLAYLFLILSFWPPIQSWSIWLICLLILIIGWRAIKKLILDLSFYFKKNERLSLIEKILFLLVIFFFIFYLSSALVPPYRTDALAYHLPEAKQIAEQGIFSLGGYGSFFANMPKLMEILYAGLFTAGSFSLIHLVHYQMFLALLVVIFCFVKKEYDRLGGLLSILGIFTLYELGVNATNAYVDGAMVAFQIVAALFFIWWWKNQEKSILILVGLLFGLAVSVKYLAWYAVVLVGLFWLIKTVLGKKTWPTILTEVAYLGIPFIIASGFWYFKSWFLVGNPFYPFIFSHQGITEEVFKSAYVAVWQFIPQTLTNYLLMPFTLFWDPYYISVLAAFLLVIIGLFFKRNRQLFIGLLGLTWVYFTLWFFAISHQRRFNFFGLILLMILAGIAAGQLINRYLPKIKSAILVILIILMVGAGGGVIFSKKNNYFWQVKKTDLLYVMGIYGEQDFYDHRDLGSIYQISNYLNNHYQQTKFFNIWKSVSFFLKNDNTFIAPDALLEAGRFSPDQLKQYLIDNKINYAIEDGPQKARDYFEATTFKGDFASDYYKFLIMSEALTESVKKIGQVIYEQAGVKIYQFDFKS